MDFSNVILGLNTVLNSTNILYCILGCVIGTVVGMLPGLGPVAAISMLLPLTYIAGPTAGIFMLAAVYYGAQYGGSTTSILLKMPGEVSSIMTSVDGNVMTDQGKAGVAILTAGISSFIAGCLAAVIIALFSPWLSKVALVFGPAEYCLLMLLGFTGVSLVTTGDIIKGFAATALGILIGCIGTDINTGLDRFTFGQFDLIDGIGFASVAVGMFGLAELIKNSCDSSEVNLGQTQIKFKPSLSDFRRIIPSSLRGSVIGGFFGLIPGGTAAVASYAAYAFDKKVSKNRAEFGHGAIEGVAAPEAANNSAAQTGFIPLLSLGIPENAVMAIMLSALVMNGIHPGPMFISTHPEIFWGLIISMLIGNVVLLILNVPLVHIWVLLLRIPYHVLYPILIVVCCIGVYSVSNNPNDILVAAIFGVLGYLFMMLNLEPAPMMLGLILGPLFEENFRRQVIIGQGSFAPFIDRPISLALLTVIIVLLVIGIVRLFNKKA